MFLLPPPPISPPTPDRLCARAPPPPRTPAQCPPAYVLPAFYLLDSICKNIGPPYLALFSRFIERAFLSAYHSVDPPTRTKLEELLGTWKTGGADGGELFRDPEEPRGPARGGAAVGRVQRGIEGALFGARGRGDGLLGRAAKDAEMYNAGVGRVSRLGFFVAHQH